MACIWQLWTSPNHWWSGPCPTYGGAVLISAGGDIISMLICSHIKLARSVNDKVKRSSVIYCSWASWPWYDPFPGDSLPLTLPLTEVLTPYYTYIGPILGCCWPMLTNSSPNIDPVPFVFWHMLYDLALSKIPCRCWSQGSQVKLLCYSACFFNLFQIHN